jgi:hypothetical protein
MSRIVTSAVFILVGVASVAQAQYPYEGIVTVESGSLHVRSGASENHYRTGVLKRDDRVTVVGEKDGWLAIKPPDGSFSWISGECVREVGNSEIEVTKDNVLVRIGTPIDPRQRDSWQLKVNRGTRFQMIERSTSGQGQLTHVWYKIPPPTGEVRYVKAQFVRPADGHRPTARPEPAMTPPRPPRATMDDTDPTEVSKHAGEADEPRVLAPRRPSVADGDAEADDHVQRRLAPANQFPNAPRGRLDRAQAAYREMMKKPLIDRNIESVRTLFEQAAKSAQTDTDHVIIAQKLEDLESQAERQGRLAELDRLLRKAKQRDESLLSMSKRRPTADAESTDETETAPPAAAAPPPSRFDGSGVLRKSSVMIDGKPAYVLASPYGGIRCYVTPAPGVDLRKYLDQIVAVRGPVNYREEVRHHHILVRDITPVEVKR